MKDHFSDICLVYSYGIAIYGHVYTYLVFGNNSVSGAVQEIVSEWSWLYSVGAQ